MLSQYLFSSLTESFVVCQNYSPPADYIPNMSNPLLDHKYTDWNQLTGSNRIIVPFLACGDLSAYDSDTNYPLEVNEMSAIKLTGTNAQSKGKRFLLFLIYSPSTAGGPSTLSVSSACAITYQPTL